MKQRSPTLEGFRAMLLRPAFGLAEIAWRWSFGTAACLLLVVAFVEYLRTLPVSGGDLVLLRTGQPTLIARALAHIFRGSPLRVIAAGAVLSLSLAIAWIVLASLARAATIKALVAYFREAETATLALKERGAWRLRSLFGLNLFRAVTTLTAVAGCLAAFLLARAATAGADPSRGNAILIFLALAILVWCAWSTLNWFLSLAAIFVVADGQDTLGAIAAAVDLSITRAGSIFAAGTWFGLAHITVFVAASFIVAFPLGLAADLPAGLVWGGVLLVTLVYFALSDFLYVGRLAAYVAILELPEAFSAPEAATRPPDTGLHLSSQPGAVVDQNELILSDVPATS
jgi:hypothetical protein